MIEFAAIREAARDVLIIGMCLLHAIANVSIGVNKPQQGVPPTMQPPIYLPTPQAPPPPPPTQAPPPVFIYPPPKAASLESPDKATVLLRNGDRACTATIIADRPGPGSYYALSAAHCVKGGVQNGFLQLKDGRTYPFRLVRTSDSADLALLAFDATESLPFARIAVREAANADSVWTAGNGQEAPGVRRQGKVKGQPLSNGMLPMKLAVSPGDSGAGVFRVDTGELIAVVSSRNRGDCYGGGVTAIRRLLGTPPGTS